MLKENVGSGAPVGDVDLFTDEVLANPHPCDAALRELGPVVWLERYNAFAVTRYKSIKSMYTDWRTFNNTGSPFNPGALIPAVIVTDNPPNHGRLRNIVMPFVSPAAVRTYRPDFEIVAKRVVDEILDEREFDARELATKFILSAFPDLLGLPKEGRPLLLDFGEAILNTLGPMNEISQRSLERAGPAFDWVQEECARERVAPDKLAGQIYALADDGAVSEEEAGLLVRTLLAAGFDTTILGITAALYGFSQNPDQWDLISDLKLKHAAFEEGIRLYPPNRFGGRIVTEDTEFEGVEMKKGDLVATLIAAAGRDPDRWDNPDSFDITRPQRPHLSFGHGIHACLGQVFSRIEYDVLVGALFERVKAIEPAGEPEPSINNVSTGWRTVPVRVTPR